MLTNWLENALTFSSLSQAELARRLTEVLNRAFPKTLIGRMLKGTRKISGDELIAISYICNFPIPDDPVRPTTRAKHKIEFFDNDYPFPDDTLVQLTFGHLKFQLLGSMLVLHGTSDAQFVNNIVNVAVNMIKCKGDYQIVTAPNGPFDLKLKVKSAKRRKRAGEEDS